MSTVIVLPEELLSGPSQARRVFTGINELAASIAKHGLMQKPTVKHVAGRYLIVAGERRIRAILKLKEAGLWEGAVECELDESDDEASDYKALIENVQREDVPLWQLGKKLLEVQTERQITASKLAQEIGKSVAYVSYMTRIGRGLHPDIVKKLDARLPDTVPKNLLLSMSQMLKVDTLEPDLRLQERALNIYLNRKAPIKRGTPRERKRQILGRVTNLSRGAIRIPVHAQPVAHAIIEYLTGHSYKIDWPEEGSL